MNIVKITEDHALADQILGQLFLSEDEKNNRLIEQYKLTSKKKPFNPFDESFACSKSSSSSNDFRKININPLPLNPLMTVQRSKKKGRLRGFASTSVYEIVELGKLETSNYFVTCSLNFQRNGFKTYFNGNTLETVQDQYHIIRGSSLYIGHYAVPIEDMVKYPYYSVSFHFFTEYCYSCTIKKHSTEIISKNGKNYFATDTFLKKFEIVNEEKEISWEQQFKQFTPIVTKAMMTYATRKTTQKRLLDLFPESFFVMEGESSLFKRSYK